MRRILPLGRLRSDGLVAGLPAATVTDGDEHRAVVRDAHVAAVVVPSPLGHVVEQDRLGRSGSTDDPAHREARHAILRASRTGAVQRAAPDPSGVIDVD